MLAGTPGCISTTPPYGCAGGDNILGSIITNDRRCRLSQGVAVNIALTKGDSGVGITM